MSCFMYLNTQMTAAIINLLAKKNCFSKFNNTSQFNYFNQILLPKTFNLFL